MGAGISEHIYSGKMSVYIRSTGMRYTDYDNLHYSSGVGYLIEQHGKRSRSIPGIVIKIPISQIFDDTKIRGGNLKRLKYYFTRMERDTTTYNYRGDDNKQHSLYDGDAILYYPLPDDPLADPREPEQIHDNTFYDDTHAFTIEMTNKAARDKPTVTSKIPLDEIDPRLLALWRNAGIDESVTITSGAGDETENENVRRNIKKDIKPSVIKLNQFSFSEETLDVEEMNAVCDAAADFCLRAITPYFDAINDEFNNKSRPDSENGKYILYRPNGEIHHTNAAFFDMCPQKDYINTHGIKVEILEDGIERPPVLCLCIRMMIQLPYNKLDRALKMLCKYLPETVDSFVAELNRQELCEACEAAYRQTKIRKYLRQNNYAAFIANGSILPRTADGISPMLSAVRFKSTKSDEITICGVTGMGIRRGVTVITGGGYSGKSTLLDAISSGIYNHVLGDGREYVLTDETAFAISAEDGRAVKNVNISPFIKWLPSGDTSDFSTAHASGSTSQAANIMEAADLGAKLLLIDEDRSATNFMIRDNKMKMLIKREPITPFTDRVEELAGRGVSTILVIGGSGEYLGVCDKVYLMDEYLISDVTDQAREIYTRNRPDDEVKIVPPPVSWNQKRELTSAHFSTYPEDASRERLEYSDMGFIIIGDETIDIRGLPDITSPAQANGIAFILREIMIRQSAHVVDLEKEIDKIYERIYKEGVDTVFSTFFTTVDRYIELPRKSDVMAVVNRMRKTIWRIRT